MAFELPSPAGLQAAATALGLVLDDAEARAYLALLAPFAEGYRVLDAMPDELPAPAYPREAGRRPEDAENPWNAWYWRTAVRGRPGGKLAGRTVVLKDNIMLAGVPMMSGTTLLEGYVPEIDATVVRRVLDAGGEIVGKAHCEAFCLSAGSHTCAAGPVHNPRRPGRSAGGSSSGCAALVAAGEVDMAIGGDQGGSIRVPAAFCGIYGMKPTHGLVPYTGILPIEPPIDHAGPMTRSVRDNALLLEVLAGADGYDPRQYAPIVQPYSELLAGGAGGLRIGVLREGFGHPLSEPDVDAKVRAAARLLERLGAAVAEISIPMHLAAGAIATPVVPDAVARTVLGGDGFGGGRADLYPTSVMERLRHWRERPDALPETVRLAALLGTYVRARYGGRYYGKAMNLARVLTRAYDRALGEVDLLLMPATPMKATPLPAPDAPLAEYLQRAFEPIGNTVPFNLTHHPAMSVPCGLGDGLPVGMMLVGRRYDEPTIYRAAHAFEQAADWTTL